jgi:hypothetical protein
LSHCKISWLSTSPWSKTAEIAIDVPGNIATEIVAITPIDDISVILVLRNSLMARIGPPSYWSATSIAESTPSSTTMYSPGNNHRSKKFKTNRHVRK